MGKAVQDHAYYNPITFNNQKKTFSVSQPFLSCVNAYRHTSHQRLLSESAFDPLDARVLSLVIVRTFGLL